MKTYNILVNYKYYIYCGFMLFFNLLCLLNIRISKIFYDIKVNKIKYNLFYVIEFLNILLIILFFQSQIYFIAKLRLKLIYLIIFYVDALFFILIIIVRQEKDFKKELFPKIKKENIIKSIILSFPLIIPIIMLFFTKNLWSIINEYDNKNTLINFYSPFYFLFDYNDNIIKSFIISLFPYIITVFIEEYYFRYILEYRHNKYIEIFSKNKDIYYINYLKESKKPWIKFSFIFALYHLSLNPIRIIYLFLSSLYDYYYKSKTKSIIFIFLYHFLWDILLFIIYIRLKIL